METNRKMFFDEDPEVSPEMAKVRRRRLVCRQMLTPGERCEAPIDFIEELCQEIISKYEAPIPAHFQNVVGYLLFSAIGDVFAQLLNRIQLEAKHHKEDEDNVRRD